MSGQSPFERAMDRAMEEIGQAAQHEAMLRELADLMDTLYQQVVNMALAGRALATVVDEMEAELAVMKGREPHGNGLTVARAFTTVSNGLNAKVLEKLEDGVRRLESVLTGDEDEDREVRESLSELRAKIEVIKANEVPSL